MMREGVDRTWYDTIMDWLMEKIRNYSKEGAG